MLVMRRRHPPLEDGVFDAVAFGLLCVRLRLLKTTGTPPKKYPLTPSNNLEIETE